MYGKIPDFALLDEIRIRLRRVVLLMTELEEEQFDEVMVEVSRLGEEIAVLKKEAIIRLSEDELKKNNEELTDITKLIQQLFDNMVQRKTIEVGLVQAELHRVSGQRKLSSYQR